MMRSSLPDMIHDRSLMRDRTTSALNVKKESFPAHFHRSSSNAHLDDNEDMTNVYGYGVPSQSIAVRKQTPNNSRSFGRVHLSQNFGQVRQFMHDTVLEKSSASERRTLEPTSDGKQILRLSFPISVTENFK